MSKKYSVVSAKIHGSDPILFTFYGKYVDPDAWLSGIAMAMSDGKVGEINTSHIEYSSGRAVLYMAPDRRILPMVTDGSYPKHQVSIGGVKHTAVAFTQPMDVKDAAVAVTGWMALWGHSSSQIMAARPSAVH